MKKKYTMRISDWKRNHIEGAKLDYSFNYLDIITFVAGIATVLTVLNMKGII